MMIAQASMKCARFKCYKGEVLSLSLPQFGEFRNDLFVVSLPAVAEKVIAVLG